MDETRSLSKKLTAHYSLIQTIYIMGYCTIFSFASVFLLSRGFTNSQVGITLTAASGLGLLFQPVVAAFADRTKALPLKWIAAIMLGIVAVFSLLIVLAPAVVLATATLYIIISIFFSTQIALVTSMSMEHINAGVPINFSLARGVGSFAFAILSFALGFLVKEFGGNIVMLLNMGLGLVGIALVLTFKRARTSNAVEEEPKTSGLWEFAVRNKRFMAVVLAVSIVFFSHVLISTYMIQIIENVGGDSSDMGIANAVAAFLELPAMALFPLILKKIKNAGTIMKLASLVFVIKSVLTLLTPSVFWIDAAQCLQFFGYAMLVPASVYYVNQVIPGVDKVKGQAFMGMTMGIGGLVGNLAGGFMLDSRGVPFTLLIGTIVSAAGLVMLVLIDNYKIKREE